MVLKRKASFTAYHGSDTPDIEKLEANQPDLKHGGDIGYGVYVSENFETANAYGKYVYRVSVNIDKTEVYDLSAENQNQVEGEEGNSILVGEFIPPFYFYIKDQAYLVTRADFDTGAVNKAKAMLIDSIEEFIPPPAASKDAILYDLEQKEGIPDLDDVQIVLENNFSPEELSEEQIVEVLNKVKPYIDEANAWAEENSALILSLDEIGQEVEAAGYKALYFERAGSIGDEILVFDENNVTIEEMIDTAKSIKGHVVNRLKLVIEKLSKVMAGENLLSKYLKETSTNRTEFASELGITPNSLDRLCSSVRRPSLELANKIEKLTKGKVPTGFWDSIPAHSHD